RDRLPQNLTQAQRDYFGAHTYERTDMEGFFHTEWTQISEDSIQTSTPEPMQATQPTTPPASSTV
nr:NADP-dependent phosphogluconate dehydrogenase [Tatlockia sp.]